MKIYCRVSSVEKKEIVSEGKDGKREKKNLYIAKMGEIGGMRVTLKAEEPFKEIVVGATIAVNLSTTQGKLDVEPKEPKPEREAKPV